MTRPAAILPLVAPSLASGADEAAHAGLKSGMPVDLWQWSLAMVAVLGAILLLAWMMRRLGNFSQLQTGKFRVLAALSLGARERVVLLQAGDKQLVLGVSPGRVQTLCVLEGADVIRSESPPLDPGANFAEKMAELMGKRQS
jgi:flagellar protein FliO/FliZ